MEDLGISADYNNILFFLSRRNVKYLIIGGVAVRYYIKDRTVKDLDILINNTDSNTMLLQYALADAGFKSKSLTELYLLSEKNRKRLENLRTMIQLTEDDIKIPNGMDIFTPTKPNIFNEIYARKNPDYIRGIPVAFPSLIDSIKMKKEDDIEDQQKKMKNLEDIRLLEEKLLGSISN